MTVIILCGTPKRASTNQKRVRSTELYALVRSTKHTHNGICFFRANSCNRQITNVISVVRVERFGRKSLCSSGRIPTRSPYCSLSYIIPVLTNLYYGVVNSSINSSVQCKSTTTTYTTRGQSMASISTRLAPLPKLIQ